MLLHTEYEIELEPLTLVIPDYYSEDQVKEYAETVLGRNPGNEKIKVKKIEAVEGVVE